MKNGRVIINRNVCDNADACGGIEVCPTGAMFWDEENKMIGYNADACIDCALCVDACPVGAIVWGEDDADYEKKKTEIENETMTLDKLEVERYGATPMSDVASADEVAQIVAEASEKYVLVEYFADETIQCLLHSIPAADIKFEVDYNGDVTYKKVQVESADEVKDCEITELPALAIYKNKELKGVIEGYYDDSQIDDFFEKIDDIK